MGPFIDDAIRENKLNNHKYEDVIVQGQIIDAKDVIREAVRHNKSSATWYYVFDDYDSYTARRDNIVSTPRADSFTAYMSSMSTAGEFNRYRSVCDYLYNRVFDGKAGGPQIPISFDYVYVEGAIKKELYNLGCKQVELFIGPKTVTQSRPVGNKSFLTGKYKYQDFQTSTIKWFISISW